jgi:hypothetical protein
MSPLSWDLLIDRDVVEFSKEFSTGSDPIVGTILNFRVFKPQNSQRDWVGA